jgi:hypothetical protein
MMIFGRKISVGFMMNSEYYGIGPLRILRVRMIREEMRG